MSEKTEDQIEKEKTAIESMKNARAHMASAINRIETLEFALKQAIDHLEIAASWVPEKAYKYDSKQSLRDAVLQYACQARGKL